MRYFITLVALLFSITANAQEWEDRKVFEGSKNAKVLRILSSTDTSFSHPSYKVIKQ